MPLNADDRIVLIRVKIERAKKHLLELEAELTAFRDNNITVIATKHDPQTGRTRREFEKLPQLPFNALSTAGDIVHNLRSALDHLAWQLVEAAGNTPVRDTSFPIAKSMDAYNSSKTGKVEGMRPEAKKAIDALKPYKGGNDALWRIYELDNIDKHRTLLTVGKDYILIGDWHPVNFFGYNLKTDNPNFAGIFDLQVEEDMQLEIGKAVSDSQIIKSDALFPSLHQLVNFVDDLVANFRPLLEY